MGLVPQTATQVTSQHSEYYRGFALATLLKVLHIWGGNRTLTLELPSWIDNKFVVNTNQLIDQPIGLKHHIQEDYDLWTMRRQTLGDSKCMVD